MIPAQRHESDHEEKCDQEEEYEVEAENVVLDFRLILWEKHVTDIDQWCHYYYLPIGHKVSGAGHEDVCTIDDALQQEEDKVFVVVKSDAVVNPG